MAATIVSLVIEFHLPGCRSLKEKRSALNGLRQKFGRQPNLACCESDHHDVLERSQWTFVAASGSAKIVDSMLNQLETYADEELDAVIIGSYRERF